MSSEIPLAKSNESNMLEWSLGAYVHMLLHSSPQLACALQGLALAHRLWAGGCDHPRTPLRTLPLLQTGQLWGGGGGPI